MEAIKYRLGLDVGSKSLGWWVWQEDDDGEVMKSIDGGVRIYSDSRDPKSGSSLAVDRRVARGARRSRDRYLKRRSRLMAQLISTGLLPEDLTERKKLELLNPYLLRVRALDTQLEPFELGRVLFHLNQRRGFKSNRIAEVGTDEKERGVVRGGIATLDQILVESGCRTVGEYLFNKHKAKNSVRFRPGVQVYPSREHYETEFSLIRQTQEPLQSLSSADWDTLHQTIFFQRDLRPVEPGKCTLLYDENELRAPLALPISQEVRILQEVNNLRVVQTGEMDRDLTSEEREAAVKLLRRRKKVTFDSLRKQIGIRLDATFNLESDRRKALDGDQTAAILRNKDFFGKKWDEYDREEQSKVVSVLLESEDDEAVVERLQEQWFLEFDRADAISAVRLPQKFSNLSEKAMKSIRPYLRNGCRYHEAVKQAFPGKDHWDVDNHHQLDKLPYYPELLERHTAQGTNDPADDVFNRLGRIANPTVHVGLNQIRKVVNAIIAKHGPPNKVMVELARDLKNSVEQKQEIRSRQTRETKKNERRRTDLQNCGREPNPEYMRRIRLWEEQGLPQARCCPYCGQILSLEMVLDSRTQVDHILPFSRTLDDSLSNKVVCCIRCNHVKGDQTPAEAFGSHTGTEYDYEEILYRVSSNWPDNKKWRFEPHAMDKYEKEKDGFLDRQLNDTRYLSKLTKTYLQYVCASPTDVSVNPGRLTALIRGKWGLNNVLADSNFKNRDDHRHHAVDAAVIALIDRSMLQRVSTEAAAGIDVDRLLPNMPEPRKCKNFRDQIRDHLLNRIVVVHRARHVENSVSKSKTSGQLHNDTAFGIVEGPDEKNRFTVCRRVYLNEIDESDGQKLLEGKARRKTICDKHLRKKLLEGWRQAIKQHKSWKQFCEIAATPTKVTKYGVRSVKCVERKDKLIGIRDRSGSLYKGYKPASNARLDVIKLPTGRFKGYAITTFDANQSDFKLPWIVKYPGAVLAVQLHINDLIALGQGIDREIYRVVKTSDNRVVAACVHEGGDLGKRDADKNDPFKYLSKSVNVLMPTGLRRLKVDELGHIFDPGPVISRM